MVIRKDIPKKGVSFFMPWEVEYMPTVRPVEDDEKIQDIIDFLKAKSERNAFLLIFQLYTGMRISEMLPLNVRHVRNVSFIRIAETKTNKEREIPLGREIKKQSIITLRISTIGNIYFVRKKEINQ